VAAARRRPLAPFWLASSFAFSLPLEPLLQRLLGFPLQHLSAAGACSLLQHAHPGVQCAGTRILLGGHDVLVLAKHPMETGNRKDQKTGEVIPAHFIQTMVFSVNGTEVAQAHLNQGISANPLVGINVANAKPGDTVTVSWTDNKGESDSTEQTIS